MYYSYTNKHKSCTGSIQSCTTDQFEHFSLQGDPKYFFIEFVIGLLFSLVIKPSD